MAITYFGNAQLLHMNFYRDQTAKRLIEGYIEGVDKFIELAEKADRNLPADAPLVRDHLGATLPADARRRLLSASA